MDKAINSKEKFAVDQNRSSLLFVFLKVFIGFGLIAILWPLIAQMKPAADAPYILKTIDISGLAEGQEFVVNVRGWPFIIRYRAEAEVNRAQNAELWKLKFPETDDSRLGKFSNGDLNLEIIVVSGTYVWPKFPLRRVDEGELRGEVAWYCPLTGSKFDDSGRLLTPGYDNLYVPNYRFASPATIEFMAGRR